LSRSACLVLWGMIATEAVAADGGASPSRGKGIGTRAESSPIPVAYCSGDYANDFNALSAKAQAFDEQPQAPYTFCVRTIAVYECPSYGPDGNLRKVRNRVFAHGTAFAYRQQNGETLLLTNQHVAEWPAVTDEDHPVDTVPIGCKRVSDSLKIVDNDKDDYEQDDIPLTRVVTDTQLDIAVVKAKTLLAVMPWRLGRSALVRERNVVDVRGFPLGAFKATNVGKVVSAYDHDEYKEWDHDDFVVDALLSQGNSGSPVFAISCKTGEFELVGVYHAGYSRGAALNVVIGIDQVRDLMNSLKRTTRGHADGQPLDAATRAQLASQARGFFEPFFPFANLPAAVRVRSDGALLFEVLSPDFPFKSYAAMVLEDLPPSTPDSFGDLGRVWMGGRQGLKAYVKAELDGDTQAQVLKVLDALRRDALADFNSRIADANARSSRERFEQSARLERTVRKVASGRADLGQTVLDLAEHLAPGAAEPGSTLAEVMALPGPAPQPPPAPDALPSQVAGTLGAQRAVPASISLPLPPPASAASAHP
jgi:hypothetical protein